MTIVSLALAAVAVAQTPPPTFPVELGLVRVEALVTRSGQPVPGLAVSDFEVRDNGVVQALETAVQERVPVDAVLVLDTSYSVSGGKLLALREAAGAFLDGLREGEEAALVSFSREVSLAQPLTSDLERVRRALAVVSARGSTALHDAVYSALRLREPGPRRTAVVVFSDGIDTLSWLAAPDVVEAARRSEAVVYGVEASEAGDRKERFLREVARATGGRVWTARDHTDLRARFLDVLDNIRARYVLSYVPRGVAPEGWHAIGVRLKRKKGDVLARPGYSRAAP